MDAGEQCWRRSFSGTSDTSALETYYSNVIARQFYTQNYPKCRNIQYWLGGKRAHNFSIQLFVGTRSSLQCIHLTKRVCFTDDLTSATVHPKTITWEYNG